MKLILLTIVSIMAGIFLYGVLFATPYNPAKDPELERCVKAVPTDKDFDLIIPAGCNEKGAYRAD